MTAAWEKLQAQLQGSKFKPSPMSAPRLTGTSSLHHLSQQAQAHEDHWWEDQNDEDQEFQVLATIQQGLLAFPESSIVSSVVRPAVFSPTLHQDKQNFKLHMSC